MKRSIFLFVFLTVAVSAYGKEFTQAYEDKLIQEVKGIYTQEAVKTPDNPTGHPVDGTPIILQAKHDFPFLSSETQKILSALFLRPSDTLTLEFAYDSPGGHFKIHYTKSGPNAVFQPNVDLNGNGVPDHVDECANILEYVWTKEIDTLGYNPPPSDGWYPSTWNNGGDGKYDIYLLDLGSAILGYTFPETTDAPNPAQVWHWTSYVVLDNDYTDYPAFHSQYEWLSVTSAHEFFHAIQMGYDAFENEVVTEDFVKPYWMEMSAVWMENQVYDYINDYIYYLPAFFNRPWISLRNFDGLHPYASVVWPMYLGEKFGIDIVKEIWTRCGQIEGDNILSATDEILANLYGSNLNNAFQEFSVWNYFTGDRANPSLFGFYSEGPLWCVDYPTCHTPIHVALTNRHTLYPAIDTVRLLPEDLGATYISFEPLKPTIDFLGGLRISVEGDSGAGWIFSLIDFMGIYAPPVDTAIPMSPSGTSIKGQGDVLDWGRFLEISMVIARGDTNSSKNFTYNCKAEFDTALFHGWVPPSADRVYQNFPNPFVIKDANSTTKFPISLENPSDVKLFIFTVLGELVWKYTWLDMPSLNYDVSVYPDPAFLPFQWDGRNLNGQYVVSGIYLYRIVTNGTSTTKKLVVVNER